MPKPTAWSQSSIGCSTISAKDPAPRPLFNTQLCAAMIFDVSRAGHGTHRPPSSSECSAACRSSCTRRTAPAGALNVFGHHADVWDADAETTGAILAAHAATAILAQRKGEQLHSALMTRDRIGQAKGIIMQSYGVDDVRAFEMLRRISQESQIKLADIAQRVIDTCGQRH